MSLDINLQSAFTAVGTAIKGKISNTEKGAPNGVATLDGTGKIPSAQLPSYVDDVVEYNNLSDFPAVGTSGVLYIDISTNKQYRWSGTTYQVITSGAVDSVAGKTGIITLDKSDVGLNNVDNTSDISKNVLSATKLSNTRTLSITGDISWSVSFNGSENSTSIGTLSNTGVTAGTYKSVTVDSKGRITNGTNPSTLSGYGITDATPSTHIGSGGSSHSIATTSTNGFMSSSDKIKLDSLDNYILPVASSSLGGVKSGTDITVDANGNVSVNDDSHNHVISNIDGLQTALNSKADNTSLNTLSTNIGNTNTDYVAIFNASLV